MTQAADFVIIGGGIAGASVGYFLAPHGRVVLLERESQPGYHSTGRSAALFLESYGTPQVRALTRASRAFLDTPPPGFSEHPVLAPRGCLLVAAPGQEQELAAHWDLLRTMTPHARRLSPTLSWRRSRSRSRRTASTASRSRRRPTCFRPGQLDMQPSGCLIYAARWLPITAWTTSSGLWPTRAAASCSTR